MNSSKTQVKEVKLLNKKFCNDLAKQIYNPRTKAYMELCFGKVRYKNKFVTHCGVSELYYHMTGQCPTLRKNAPIGSLFHFFVDNSSLMKAKDSEFKTILQQNPNPNDDDYEHILWQCLVERDFWNLEVAIQDLGKDGYLTPLQRAKSYAAQLRKIARLLPD